MIAAQEASHQIHSHITVVAEPTIQVPRMVAASLLGFLAGQLLNSLVLVRIKRRSGERRLWIRLLGYNPFVRSRKTLLCLKRFVTMLKNCFAFLNADKLS